MLISFEDPMSGNLDFLNIDNIFRAEWFGNKAELYVVNKAGQEYTYKSPVSYLIKSMLLSYKK